MVAKTPESDITGRLRRIEGQARGIQKMLEEGRDCEEMLRCGAGGSYLIYTAKV